LSTASNFTPKSIAQKDLALEKASSDLQRNRIIRNGLIAGIIAFVFVVIFIYRSQKAKVRANQLLLQKNSEIEEKNKEIKSIEAAKTKWFINIAHELRTPLTLIKGPVRHALLSDPSNDQVHDHLRIADRNVNRLQKLVNEILDISKMESGMMPLNLKNVDLTELVLSAMAAFDDEAMDLGVKLEAVLNLEEPLIGRADGEKINNVIINLISNALKFTHKGGIVTVGLSSENDLIHLYVEDTGEGISQEDIERVFDRFYQASNSAGKQGGTGVGLALCKEIAKMHHGELLVSSELGEGSRFELIIPHVKPFESAMPEAQDKLIPEIIPEISPQPEEAMANESLYKGKCILIVDDNEDMRDYIATFLRNDFELLTAREGAEALGILKGHTPDLIISDIMMPGMDGLAFTKAVKLSDEWSSIPFITLSAVSDRQEKVRTLRIGIDDYIVKPFDGEELLVRVQNLICNYAERLSLGGEKEEEVSHEQKILKKLEQEVYEHIEDSNFNVQRLAEIASMSERQLYRYIKQMTGLTPASFVREVRLQRAMELLQKGIYKRTSQVSYAVGFQQPAYFSTVFKKRFGRTPSEYIDD
jgi:signal transduction histidine kinase/DNA-binding response OmpR family regulator